MFLAQARVHAYRLGISKARRIVALIPNLVTRENMSMDVFM